MNTLYRVTLRPFTYSGQPLYQAPAFSSGFLENAAIITAPGFILSFRCRTQCNNSALLFVILLHLYCGCMYNRINASSFSYLSVNMRVPTLQNTWRYEHFKHKIQLFF